MYFINTKSVHFYFQLVFFIIYSQIDNVITTSVPPASPMTTIPYFGSRIISLLYKITDLFQFYPLNASSPQTYWGIGSLGKTYQNISSTHIILSTFESNVNDYFGYSTSFSYPSFPATSINIFFTIKQNSSMLLFGFSAIIVVKTFDQFFLYHQFHITTNNVPSVYKMKIPELRSCYYFVMEFVGISDGSTINVLDSYTYSSYPDQEIGITLQFAQFINGITSAKILFIVLDRTITAKNNQLVFMTWDITRIIKEVFTNFSNANFKIDTTKYGLDFWTKCIVGFPNIYRMSASNPYFKYTPSSSGVNGGVENSFQNQFQIQTICILDLQCPITHTFKLKQRINQCFDCVDGFLMEGKFQITKTAQEKYSACLIYDLMQEFTQSGTLNRTCFVCRLCQPNYFFLNNIGCFTCGQLIQNCITCQDPNVCLTCLSPISLLNLNDNKCALCSAFLPDCLECLNSITCIKCYDNFVISKLTGNCICHGCLSGTYFLNKTTTFVQYYCLTCDKRKYFELKNKKCQCIKGYYFDNMTETCKETCGDGINFNLQCDDGNSNDNDGCKNSCTLDPSFNCTNNGTGFICKKMIVLYLKIVKILTNSEYSATITIEAQNDFFPFPLDTSNFPSNDVTKRYLEVEVKISQNPLKTKKLKCKVISANNRQIQIFVQYDFDIEGLPATITLNTQKTQYICPNDQVKLNFTFAGSDWTLRNLNFAQIYKGLRIQMFINTILAVINLIAGIFSTKFIGLECVLTIQLIYYSQLLINPWHKSPAGFIFLKDLKYINGYNNIFELSEYFPLTLIERKYSYFSTQKLPIQNYNLSLLVLLIAFVFFLGFIYLKKINNDKINDLLSKQVNKKEKLLSKVYTENNQSKSKKSMIQVVVEKEKLLQKYIRRSFNLLFQVSTWSILQILNAVSAYLVISNSESKIIADLNLFQKFIYKTQYIIILFIVFIIISFIINSKYNMFLSNKNSRKVFKNPEQTLYKFTLCVYLFLIGFIIFFMNAVQITAWKFSLMSSLALVLQIIFMIIVHYLIKPYKNSLPIHKNVLLLKHFIYLIFLFQINLINGLGSENNNDVVFIVIGYFTVILCFLANIMTFVRLYYEYRFGSELERKLKEEEIRKQKQQKQKEEKKMRKKILNYEKKGKKLFIKTDIQQFRENNRIDATLKQTPSRKRNFNRNLRLQDQILEEKKLQLLNWLQKRDHLTLQMRQDYYYQKFDNKPLNWLKKNDYQLYRQLMELNKKDQNEIQIQQQKKETNQPLLIINKKFDKNKKNLKINQEKDKMRR